MPKANWEIDTSWFNDFDDQLAEGILDLCEGAAEMGLDVAKQAVPNLNLSRGYATDALRESGYVISKRSNDYNEAVGRAIALSPRIKKRGEVEKKLSLSEYNLRDKTRAVAAFHFPLTYADLIRKGFYHVKGDIHITGIEYIQTATNRVDSEFAAASRVFLASLMAGQKRLPLRGF